MAMTTTAAVLTYGAACVAVCGLLKWAFGAMAERKHYVTPDEQAFHTRTIRLRPQIEQEQRVETDEL